jgi:uncharacterized protein (TIGR02145 family)
LHDKNIIYKIFKNKQSKTMKKITFSTILLLLGLTACFNVSVTDVALNERAIELTVGETKTLIATVLPENAANRNVTWSSDNPNVATVDNNGVVTAVLPGTAIIRAATKDGDFIGVCEVTVTVAVAGIRLNRASATLRAGETEALIATVTPGNATNQNVTWSSSNPNIATVSSSGVVTAVSLGTAIIRVATEDGDFIDVCEVRVTTVAVEHISTSPSLNGVVINGIRWATRNVDVPGTFAQNPESSGMFFQWNRRRGWIATGAGVSDWDSSMPSGTSWTRVGDPCPQGWRVPTQAELERLTEAPNVWGVSNGVNGRIFGVAPNQIFLPATGFRNSGSALNDAGYVGFYWSSSAFDANNGWFLWFSGDSGDMSTLYRTLGFSVRCVGE